MPYSEVPGEQEKCDLCPQRIYGPVRGDKHAMAISGDCKLPEARDPVCLSLINPS